jgi:hypothetical protein
MNPTESGIVIEVTPDSRKASCARNSAGQPASSLDEWGGGAKGAYTADGYDRVGNGDRLDGGALEKSLLRAIWRGSASRFP